MFNNIIGTSWSFSASGVTVSRAGHVPDELQLLAQALRVVRDAGGVPLERQSEATSMVNKCSIVDNIYVGFDRYLTENSFCLDARADVTHKF